MQEVQKRGYHSDIRGWGALPQALIDEMRLSGGGLGARRHEKLCQHGVFLSCEEQHLTLVHPSHLQPGGGKALPVRLLLSVQSLPVTTAMRPAKMMIRGRGA